MQIDPTAGTGDMPFFPEALKHQKQWTVYVLGKKPNKKGKLQKYPIYATSLKLRKGVQGSEADLQNLVDFDTAFDALNKLKKSGQTVWTPEGHLPVTGLGFAMLKGAGLTCIDIDKTCKKELRQEIISRCNSFTEKSVSGEGLHVWVRYECETMKNQEEGIDLEVFSDTQFIAVTGNIQTDVKDINPLSDENFTWLKNLVKPEKDRQRQATGQPKKATPVAESEQSDIARLVEALSHIPPDCAYDEWVKIGAAIYSEFGENGFSLWDAWSSRGSKYNPEEMRGKYSSFAKITQVRIPTVYHVAMQSGWKPKATAEWIQAQTLKHFEVIDPATGNAREASKAAVKICDTFAAKLKETLELDPAVTLDDIKATYKINPIIVDRFINETIRDKNSSEKLHLLTRSENLNSHLKKEAWTHLVATYGQPYDAETLEKDMDAYIALQTAGMKKGEADDFAKSVRQVIFTLRNAVYWHVDHYNQRTQLSFSVDMFAQVREVELLEDKAHFTLTHRNIVPMKNTAYMDYDKAVIEDYKQHFPEFEAVLRFLVMSRFAPDRKKSYLWLHVVSDWGKGFFKAILENLRLCVELSVKEVEGMFEGKPSGQHPDNFRRAFAVIFDEFKTVKSEIKQLERRISLAPKFELRSEVELFAKLFFSAENVHSLIGASGIEDQMANRFNCIRGANQKLEDRELFKKIGSSEYLRHLTGFAAEYLNKGVKSMQDLGRIKAEKYASEWLGKFHEKYGIDKLGKRLSHILPEIAEEFREYLYQQWNFCGGNFSHDYLFTDAKGNLCLKKPQKVISDWLKEQCDPSELATMMHKRDELLKLVAQDGNVTTRAIKNPHTKENARAITIR